MKPGGRAANTVGFPYSGQPVAQDNIKRRPTSFGRRYTSSNALAPPPSRSCNRNRTASVTRRAVAAEYVTVRLREKPSYYFYRQCWISGDPDEKAFGHVVDFVGADKFFWASDFPHLDHPGNYTSELRELVEPMSATTRQKVIGENASGVYGL